MYKLRWEIALSFFWLALKIMPNSLTKEIYLKTVIEEFPKRFK